MTPILVLVLAATPVKFEEAVQKALEQHPALRVATMDTARARAQVEQVRASSLPYLGVNAIGTQLDAPRAIAGNVLTPAQALTVNAQLQVPIFVANRWAAWKRSSVNADAVEATSLDMRRQVALNAGRAWLQVLAQKRVVEATERAFTTSNAHLDYARSRREAGIGSEIDQIRAQQEVAVSKQQHATAMGNLRRLEEFLGVAMGTDESVTVEDLEPGLKLPDQVDDQATERTDIKAAKVRLSAAHEGTQWDWSDYTPLLTAVLTPGYQNPATVQLPTWNFQGQLLLSLPIYDGGLRYGQEHERRAIETQARAQLEAAQRQATAEVRAALAQVQQADEALQAAQESADSARRAMDLSQQAFRAGASTNIEVVDAERRSRDADTTKALAEDTSRQARLEVLSASGKFP